VVILWPPRRGIMSTQVLPQAEPVALWQEYHRTRDVGLRNTLVLQHMGLVHSIANHYAPLLGEPPDDLIQEGCLGLIRAVERFRPEYGTQFSTYAYPVVSGVIKNYLRRCRRLRGRPDWHAPEGPSESGPVHARSPALAGEELLPSEDLEALAGAVKEDFADQAVARMLTESLLSHLSALERRIITHLFYEDLTQREIARLLARSDSRVSRLLRRALDRIRLLLVRVQQEEGRLSSAAEPIFGFGVPSVVDLETGLFGPEHLERCLSRELARAEAFCAPLSLALLRPQVPASKLTARRLSHIARRLYRNVRVLDHVFRAGPNELALLLTLPPSDAARVCDRFQTTQPQIHLDCAISSFPHDADSPADLLAAAHERLPAQV